MQIPLGTLNNGQTVFLDTKIAVNGHLQVSAVTGFGKTTQLKSLVKGMVESASQLGQPLRIHVFDPHGDIELPYCSEVIFSEATEYGYNPLEINSDVHSGGVRRAIQKFLVAIQKQKNIGPKQEAVMRYLLEDLYAAHGFKADDPSTWQIDDPRMIRQKMEGKEGRVYLNVAFEHVARFKELIKNTDKGIFIGGWDADPSFRCWWVDSQFYDGDLLMWEPRNLFKVAPTIDDAVRFVERKLKAQFCGTNSAAMTFLKEVNVEARKYHNKIAELSKRGDVLSDDETSKLETSLKTAKEKAVQAYASYLDAIRSGRELDDLIRYSSVEVLTSVYERFQNLKAIGIYNKTPPPFLNTAPVWRYIINCLEIPVQRMLVDRVCSLIFERSTRRGIQTDVVEVIVLDEGKRYVTDDENDILSVIAGEARKFGLALWVASQSPAHFPDDFLKATGTIIVLGLAEADTNLVARKLGIEADLFSKITPHKTALVQVKNRGQLTSDFQLVNLTQNF